MLAYKSLGSIRRALGIAVPGPDGVILIPKTWPPDAAFGPWEATLPVVVRKQRDYAERPYPKSFKDLRREPKKRPKLR